MSPFGYGPLADLAVYVLFLGLALLFLAGALGFTDYRKLSFKVGEVGLMVLYTSFTLFLWFYPGVAWAIHSATGLPEIAIDLGVTLIGLVVGLVYARGNRSEGYR